VGLFGKDKITELHAVSECIGQVLKSTQKAWPEIKSRLDAPLIGATDLDDTWSPFEFSLALVSLQVQGLGNMMPAEQAHRVRSFIFGFFQNSQYSEQAVPIFTAYVQAWQQALGRSENPLDGLAALLHRRLRCKTTTTLGESEYISPLALMAISELLMEHGKLGWWKALLSEYRLVPDR
jgi:hypothetical protein